MSRRYVVALACLCTLVAVLLSVAGAWSRAGLPVERGLFAAVAVLLTVGAHVIPALCWGDRARFRVLVAALWAACLAVVVAGHLAFFTAAERHAGESRAIEAAPAGRSVIVARPLSEVAAEQATVANDIARARVGLSRCRDCAQVEARLAGLVARAEALTTERAEAERRIAIETADEARRSTAMTDPVAARVGEVVGIPPDSAALAIGVTSALVLELFGCLLWVKVAGWSTSTAH